MQWEVQERQRRIPSGGRRAVVVDVMADITAVDLLTKQTTVVWCGTPEINSGNGGN